ncbi:MAG: ABC transporter permease [Chloroflexi bacterium]|nr:ABC transporter permease [Chloroflexota bacterium]MCL5109185.1 ABC transporter permease [Chloroflexota bacterium]
MTQYLLRRVAYFVPVIFLVTVVVFAITLLLPGDPALAFLGEGNIHDEVAYQAMRKELGLDQPVPVQYGLWVARAVQGDLGRSVRTREPVLEGLGARLPVTLQLMAMALAIALLVAIPAGIISAAKPNSKIDGVGTVLAIGGVAIPEFWLGILLIYIFAVWLGWLPPSGYVSPSVGLWPSIRSMLLPAISLGMALNAVTMRQVRSSLIEVLQHEYITTARAKGLAEGALIFRHALKNAMIPVVTVIGLQIGRLFGGSVVVETIFALPGMGRLAADSIFFRDFPMLQGVVLIMAVSVLIANLITDLVYAYLDPRIRYS